MRNLSSCLVSKQESFLIQKLLNAHVGKASRNSKNMSVVKYDFGTNALPDRNNGNKLYKTS